LSSLKSAALYISEHVLDDWLCIKDRVSAVQQHERLCSQAPRILRRSAGDALG
jgi:hypothetical protein